VIPIDFDTMHHGSMNPSIDPYPEMHYVQPKPVPAPSKKLKPIFWDAIPLPKLKVGIRAPHVRCIQMARLGCENLLTRCLCILSC
jgi:hypothetical protein